MCQHCNPNQTMNCQTCANSCKIPQNGTNWHCGAWMPKPLTDEEKQKVNAALDEVWRKIEGVS